MTISIIISFLILTSGLASEDEYWLARVIQGEAGINATPAVALLIDDSIQNRISMGWCDSIEDCVLSAYWGHINAVVPSEHSIKLARLALGKRHRERLPVVFVFSRSDVAKLCLNPKEAAYRDHLYFYEEKHYATKCQRIVAAQEERDASR